jgi:putative redox protein
MQRSCSNLDLETMLKTRQHVAANPDDGKGSFETVTEWRDGAVAVTRARSFTIETDEPTPLGGTDSAIDPMELLLASLGTCLTIGWVTHANRRGVDFRDLKISVRAPYDLRGYLGLDAAVRPGFTSLEYDVEVDSDADPAVLEEIKAAAERGSPMLDNIRNATPISGSVRPGM